jgi:hypothetical protein
MVRDWKDRSKKAGTSISKFVIERVEDSNRHEDGEGTYSSRLELIEIISKNQKELKQLRDENRRLGILVDTLDAELKRYRAQPFLDEGFQGVRSYDKELIELLKRGETLSDDAILNQLNISPIETDLVKAVSNQLQALETMGLVRFSGRGWKWIE